MIKRILASLTAALLATACAPIVGAPRAVIQPAVMRQIVADHSYDTSIRAFYGTAVQRDGLSRQDYRDMIVAVYLGAIDAEYYEFRGNLAASGRGSALGLDLLVLGLSGATAVASAKDMAEFAVATTVAGGARAAVDKNLFFDRTLPSVISAMDAERARVKAAIEAKLDLNAQKYPLSSSFSDISEYQLAGTLERGMQRVAAIAAADAANAQAELDRAITACKVIEEIAEENSRLTDALRKADGSFKSERLKITAQTLGVPTGANDQETFRAIISYLNSTKCTRADRSAEVNRIMAAIEKAEAPAADGDAAGQPVSDTEGSNDG